MSTTDTRNSNAKQYVDDKIKAVRSKAMGSKELASYSDEIAILDQLIPINANGFRGVVLTSIVGMYLDDTFDPSVNFYNCNPRSIFEKGIYYALEDNNIPCGKSDPLNVAKNIQQLDSKWAKGRRPESAALAAVEYIELLVSNRNTPTYENLVNLFFQRLSDYGSFVSTKNFAISTKTINDIALITANKLASFVVECSEGGSNTQYITGLLLKYVREDNGNFIDVVGYDESVFGTNTTSKKPADIWEILSDGTYGNLYEITVKIVDNKRLDDCVDSLNKLNLQDNPVTFICDLPANTNTLSLVDYVCIHKNVAFQFIDIKEFIKTSFCLLTMAQRAAFLTEVQNYVFSVKRAVKTKDYWKTHFGI
jgi:hypothetical protein